jgi:protein tyrosine/serine phosphatase
MPRLESTHLFGLDGLVNVGKVTEGVYRGADPAPEGFKTLADVGFKTILNLSHENDDDFVRPFSIREIRLPMGFFGEVEGAKVRKAVALLSDASLHPIYVHCAQGRDRTGMVVACYRIESGWPTKEAIDEMESFGFHYVWSHFLEFVQGYRKGGGRENRRSHECVPPPIGGR